MLQKQLHTRANVLLDHLSPENRAAMFTESERVHLEEGAVVANPEEHIEHVVFPLTCVLSTLSVLPDLSGVETAVTGNEGVAPLGVFHGVDTVAEQTVVQIPGEALRVSARVFLRGVANDRAFGDALHRFASALFTFAAQTSGCNRRHSVVQRCSRWLMQTHDRVPGDEFDLTHLFLSQMMGVRRSSVTVAAEALRAAGAISYTRGSVKVVNRERLQSQGCECYAIVRAVYDRLLRTGDSASPLAGLRMSQGGRSLVGGPRDEVRIEPRQLRAGGAMM